MIVLRLAWQSLSNRWITALLTILSIALSVGLLLGVEKVRTAARDSFSSTLSGTDLIIGARTGDIQLLLYSVFRIGNATNNMSWKSYSDIAKRPEIKWIVPLSLGDSHRGFRVLATTRDYFKFYKFRDHQSLRFSSGNMFDDLFDTVIGADVAKALHYSVGDKIIISHGISTIGQKHDATPFRVAGILTKTGTPVDRTVHISLKAMEAIHVDWRAGFKMPGRSTPAEVLRHMPLRTKAITAALAGLKSRLQTFTVQRYVNNYRAEPLSAVIPGLTLYKMWALVGTAEKALIAVSLLVVTTAILGMMIMIFSTLNERRREISILRSVGAGPATIIGLLVSEAAILTALGVALGTGTLYVLLWASRSAIDQHYGLYVAITAPTGREYLALGAILLGGLIAGFLPAWRAYRVSVADGMIVRT